MNIPPILGLRTPAMPQGLLVLTRMSLACSVSVSVSVVVVVVFFSQLVKNFSIGHISHIRLFPTATVGLLGFNLWVWERCVCQAQKPERTCTAALEPAVGLQSWVIF